MAYEAKTNWQLNDTVMPEDMNRIEQGIQMVEQNSSTSFKATATIPTTGWTTTAPYSVTISVPGMRATDENFPVSPILADTLTTRKAQLEAWSKITMIKAETDTIVVTCDEELPTTEIPIQITVVR